MTIVDTSVWIDFLKGGNHWTKARLKEKLNDRESILYNEMILLKIIQGIRERKGREEIEGMFSSLVLVPKKDQPVYSQLRSTKSCNEKD